MPKYITVKSVRRTCGILEAEINNTDVLSTIEEVESLVPRFMNTVFTPTERIEIRDGNGTSRLILKQNPLLGVRDLYIDGAQEDAANLHVYKQSGKIVLDTSASTNTFLNKPNAIVVKYIYGMVEESDTSTTTSAATTAGTSVSLSVAAITGFKNNDWLEIYGMDGYKEIAQINATPTGTTIQVDQLVQTHESGSTVVKMVTSEQFKRLMNLVASLALIARIVGQSYTDIVGYTISEMSVQKGEPYTQWRETAIQFIRERDMIMSAIKPRPYTV